MARSQGQMRNGKRAVPKEVCPKCDTIMQRFYKRSGKDTKRAFISIGWYCPNPTCDYLIKDFVELEDTEEGEKE
jgi:ssDNA-binding Zn-finger/Zn-ribbon topoisomerase 1